MRKSILLFSLILFSVLQMSCEREMQPAGYEIVDNNRHYFPIQQGNKINIQFEVRDTSDNPLFIKEIQTSSGLSTKEELPLIILPGKSAFLKFSYNSTKHIGKVDHFINLFGNFAREDGKLVDTTMVTINFDINVVPPADYIHDYEQYYYEENGIRDLVDGKIGEKGYYREDGTLGEDEEFR